MLTSVVQGDTVDDLPGLLQNNLDLSRLLSSVDLGLLVQSFLGANRTLSLSNKCQASFVDMTFPLPQLTPQNMAGFNALDTVNHPILQCKCNLLFGT